MRRDVTGSDRNGLGRLGPAFAEQQTAMVNPSGFPLILVIGSDPVLHELCRERLPWAGYATEFVDDVAEAMTNRVVPDVMLADLPAGPHAAAVLTHLCEFAGVVGTTVIALTDDPSLLERGTDSGACQVLARACPPEALWDALAIAITSRTTPPRADEWHPDQ